MDKNELKVEALRQRVGQLTVEHEDRAADYRVEITLLTQRLQELEAENNNLKASLESKTNEEVHNITTAE